ncbi:hypothetical protein CEXT_165631 [Caerostris extrusa]|uniref:Uncharacterized protein n=1 Tax=Caerostris extrusa TaxID=172846 RepID=A0AAV4SJI2_CAEEX|nr:hypothetical protein CEXT_165631 [Caerostris extrusa]
MKVLSERPEKIRSLSRNFRFPHLSRREKNVYTSRSPDMIPNIQLINRNRNQTKNESEINIRISLSLKVNENVKDARGTIKQTHC